MVGGRAIRQNMSPLGSSELQHSTLKQATLACANLHYTREGDNASAGELEMR